MEEVKPFMYSPLDLPSRTRAAPAKKRIWSTIGGISSLMVTPCGLPVFSHSMSTSSSAFSSMTSASLSSARCRSAGVVHRHFSNAVPEAWQAASMSSALEFGDVAYTSPVEGLTMSSTSPDALGRLSPSMMLLNVFLSDMIWPFIQWWCVGPSSGW